MPRAKSIGILWNAREADRPLYQAEHALYYNIRSDLMLGSRSASMRILIRALLSLFLLYVGGLLMALLVFAQELAIEISYVEVQDHISPRPRISTVTRTTRVNLSAGNVLAVNENDHYTAISKTFSRQVHQGEVATNDRGVTTRWRPGGSNVLIRESTYPSHIARLTIRTQGNSCQAEISFHLKPGQKQYVMFDVRTHEPDIIRSLQAQSVTCRIIGG
jgi:hypothetical protein